MSTPSLSSLPPDLQKIIQEYVAQEAAKIVASLAAEQGIVAPKVLTPHEQLLDHHARAVAASTGDPSPILAAMATVHTLAALQLLIKEVEELTPSTAPAVSATTSVAEGAI